jgi:hypothetical protein
MEHVENPAWEGALQGMQESTDHADRKVEGWSLMAYDFFTAYAYSVGRPFLTEEVVKAFEEAGLPSAPNNCAWGSIARRAKLRGLVVQAGFDYCKLGKGHTKPMTLWAWKTL